MALFAGKDKSRLIIQLILAAQLGFVLFFYGHGMAGSLTLGTQFSYSDDSDRNDSVSRTYRLGGSHRVELTELMGYSAGVRYNRQESDNKGERGVVVNETLAPSMNFRVNNDLFSYNFSGSGSRRWGTYSKERNSLNFQNTISNVITRKFWPDLSLSFGKSLQFDDESPRRQDNEALSSSLNVDWDLILAQIRYNLSWNEAVNNITESVNTNTSQSVRFNTSGRFLDNRASVAFSQDYSIQNQVNETKVSDASTATLRIARPSLTARDWTPDPWSDPAAFDPAAPGLTDGDIDTTATSVNADENYDLVLRVERQQVDTIYIYTRLDLGAPDVAGWVLQSNDVVDGTTAWTNEANPAVTYDATARRFVINTGGVSGKTYLRLYHLQASMPKADITEVEAWQSFSTSAAFFSREIESTSSKSNVSFSFRFTPSLSFSTSLSLQNNDSTDSTRPDEKPENKRRGVAGSLAWRVSPLLNTSLSVSQNVDEKWQQEERMGRSYSLSMGMSPLPSVGLSLGAGRSESSTGGIRTSTSNNLNLSASAALFRDLNSSLNAAFGESINELTGQTSESFSTGLNLGAKPTPKLQVSFSSNYSTTKSSVGESSSSSAISLGTTWRPSEILSVQANTSRSLSESDSPTPLSLNISYAPTRKNRLNLQTAFSFGRGNTTQDYSLNWNWSISRYLSVITSGTYKDDGNVKPWTISSTLRANFSR